MSTPRAWKQEAADLRKAVEKERGAAEAAEAEAASLREALDGERRAVRALRRDLQRQLKAAREAEATKTNDLLQQLRNKLTLELTEAVKNEREAAIKSTTAELQRLHQAQETELRKEFSRKEEDLRRQLRDALAHSRHPDASADTLQTSAKQAMAAPCPPAADVLALRALNKRLETRVQELEEAERRNADAVRSQYEEHSMREAEQQKMARRETHLLLEKLKSRDRSIENLEREITTLKGRLDETRNVRDRFDSEKRPQIRVRKLSELLRPELLNPAEPQRAVSPELFSQWEDDSVGVQEGLMEQQQPMEDLADAYVKRFNSSAVREKCTPLSALSEGVLYPVQRARIVKTRYGKKVILQVVNTGRRQGEAGEIEVFLPARFNEVINETNLEEFNEACHRLAVGIKHVSPKWTDVKLIKQ